MQLRPYQVEAKAAAIKAWSTGAKGVCIVMPTGAGKTATLASIVKDHGGYSVVAAHRQEIISQLSLSLAREGIRHRIVGSTSLIKLCVQIHLSEIGKDFYDPNATCAVASVQTLTARTAKLSEWAKTITLVVGDEHHHYVRDNQFGKAIQLFPNAKLLGVTATPIRADGKGLGSHADGFVDALVEGPTMQWLIANGFLSSYRIFAPPSDLDLSEVNISKATGDYVKDKLVKAVHKSHIVGDVVEHYKKLAFGKRGLTFCTDVKTATDLAEEFNKAGVPAIALSGKTPDRERIEALKKFKRGEYLQITSVSLFDEGTDIPAVECVSFAAPTASFGRYIQSFGRGLRPVYAEGLPLNTAAERLYAMSVSTKPNAIIIDHVGNVVRHGLPDANREWSLDQREKRASNKPDDVIPVRACPECTMVYEKTHIACPYCGFKPVPAERSSPEQVDGDLMELSPEVLAQMRGAVAEVDMDPEQYRLELIKKRVPEIGQLAAMKRHRLRKEAQAELRDAMRWWGGYREAEGLSTREAQKLFFFKFGIDYLSAQALSDIDAKLLEEKVRKDME